MINTNVFNYINVLDKAADAAWLRNDAIANNIANATTPGYQRQDVAFEAELQKALGYDDDFEKMDQRVARVNNNLNVLNPVPYLDNGGYAYRLDGNSVDPEMEQVMLAENQLKYQGLMASITQEFKNLQTVIK